MKRVEIVGLHLEATTGAPLVLLREEEAPHRVLPIFVGASEAASIAMALSDQVPSRPLTHDVMAALVEGLHAEVERVEVTEVRDGAFRAELTVNGPGGGQRFDSRPSDAIALAVRLHAPMFVSDALLDEAGTVLHDAPDEETIDGEVAEFRSFLEDVEPGDFAVDPLSGPGPASDADQREEDGIVSGPAADEALPGRGDLPNSTSP